jgi:organic radical activating enzyme
MNTVSVELLGTRVNCRGYWCSHSLENGGDPLSNPQFIFYLMATDQCNGLCSFCDIQRKFFNKHELDPDTEKLRIILTDLFGRNLISKISITGGEPLLDPNKTNKLINVIFEANPEAIVDITTNGSLLKNLLLLEQVDKISTIHISRHHFETVRNNEIFSLRTASFEKIQQYADRFFGKISLNCCLVPGYVDSPQMVEQYLDWAATIRGLKSAGLISLIKKNVFCENSQVNEKIILEWIDNDPNNIAHNYNYDTDICECRSWQRIPSTYLPITCFWWKVKRLSIPYCRQMVFTADNRLTVNFKEIGEIQV